MSLLDRSDAPRTRRDVSDYAVDMPVMDGPYGNTADHAAGHRPDARDFELFAEAALTHSKTLADTLPLLRPTTATCTRCGPTCDH